MTPHGIWKKRLALAALLPAVVASCGTSERTDLGSTRGDIGDMNVTLADAGMGVGNAEAGNAEISLRVHHSASELTDAELVAILEEVNEIWSVADVCFEAVITTGLTLNPSGLDLWMTATLDEEDLNGFYDEVQTVVSLDVPSLGDAPHPTRFPASRTIAHELGHALSLEHQNCGEACRDLLMTSGRRGYQLMDSEIAEARSAADARASRSVVSCPAPRFE